MMHAIGLEMCNRCGCYEAHYLLKFDDPDTRTVKEWHLCRACQRSIVTVLDRCQGMME